MRVARRTLGTGGARASAIAGLIVLAGALAIAPSPASDDATHAAAASPGPLSSGRAERFAGTGLHGGFTGDGVPAFYSELASPLGVAADAHGTVYIADEANVRIRRVSAKGIITTIAGGHGHFDTGDGGPATAAGLMSPGSVAVDAHGNVYEVSALENPDNTRVRVIESTGTIRTFAGTDTPGFSGDGGPAVSARLDHPQAVATDGEGNVFIGERQRIRKVGPNGIISTIAGTGVRGFAGDGGPAAAARLTFVSALAADPQGNVYVGDGTRVRRIDRATGTITTVAGTGVAGFSGDGAPATSAKIGLGPRALAVDGHGILYIADTSNSRVRAVDGAGRITTIVGGSKSALWGGWGGPGRSVSLSNPGGLAVDSQGRLLISNSGGHMLWRFTRGLTREALGRCTRRAARQTIEQRHLGNSYDLRDPVRQVFCGPFAGRRSHTMVVSLRLPSCGAAYGWLVYRSVRGTWKRVLKVNSGAHLTRSQRRILEWRGVLAPTDAHCLPSSYRVRAWRWNGERLVHGSWHRKPKLPRHLPGLGP